MILSAFLLAALVKLLIETESPRLCAGIYGAMLLVLSVFSWLTERASLSTAILSFLLGTLWGVLYFSVLNQFDFGTSQWWTFMLVGLFVPALATAAFRWVLSVTWLAHMGVDCFTHFTPVTVAAARSRRGHLLADHGGDGPR